MFFHPIAAFALLKLGWYDPSLVNISLADDCTDRAHSLYHNACYNGRPVRVPANTVEGIEASIDYLITTNKASSECANILMIRALSLRSLKDVQKVIAYGVDVNIKLELDNRSLSHFKAGPLKLLLLGERFTGYGQSRKQTTLPIVQYLLQVGADPTSRGSYTALGIAISRRMIDVVQAILEAISWVMMALEGQVCWPPLISLCQQWNKDPWSHICWRDFEVCEHFEAIDMQMLAMLHAVGMSTVGISKLTPFLKHQSVLEKYLESQKTRSEKREKVD